MAIVPVAVERLRRLLSTVLFTVKLRSVEVMEILLPEMASAKVISPADDVKAVPLMDVVALGARGG